MIDTYSYTDFSVEVHTRTMPDRVPVNGMIEVTHRCPLECAPHNDHYNVRDGSMREGWDMFLRTVREKRITRVTKCTTCPLTSLCNERN